MWTTSLQADIPVWIMDVELYKAGTPQADIPILIMDVELYKDGTPYFISSRYSSFDNGCGTLQGWDFLLHSNKQIFQF